MGKALDRAVKKTIRDLENALQERTTEVVALRAELEGQGVATTEIIEAGMSLRQEEVEDLARYQARITELTKFVEEVAASRTKYSKKARKLLGIS